MRKVLASVLFLLMASALALKAQNVSDLIISEALAQPDSTGILDDYGRRSGWIELYNKSTGTVNFGGCYLTDDRAALRKSVIPKGDLRTKLGPRQTVLFFCSGNGTEGTFYAGFTLSPGKTVYLVSNDGRTIIDSLQVPASLPPGKSVIKLAPDIRQQQFQAVSEPASPSPGILNGNPHAVSKGELMKERDPRGWILTIVSVSVVFCALALLWFLFWLLFDRTAKKKAAASAAAGKTKAAGRKKITLSDSEESAVAAAVALALDMEAGGDTYAAIATAVHLYLGDAVHDVEPGIVTLVRKPSAWDNKSLNFRKLPREI